MTTLTHLAQLALALVLLVLSAHVHPLLALAAALNVYLMSFAFTHDTAHGALRLPRWLTESILALAALPMGVSGHALRRLHLRHHARPLAADDVEGAGAALPFWGAVRIGPVNAAEDRIEAFRAAPRSERLVQLLETGAGLILAALALTYGGVAGAAWVVVAVAMQLTASVWASHLSHRPPSWLKAIALKLAWTRNPAVLSFVFHDEHHARPKQPCAELGRS